MKGMWKTGSFQHNVVMGAMRASTYLLTHYLFPCVGITNVLTFPIIRDCFKSKCPQFLLPYFIFFTKLYLWVSQVPTHPVYQSVNKTLISTVVILGAQYFISPTLSQSINLTAASALPITSCALAPSSTPPMIASRTSLESLLSSGTPYHNPSSLAPSL